MAIYIAKIEVEHIEVSLKNKPQSLLDYSPKGTVPVVVTQQGDVIEQSRDIMLWALQKSDPGNWLLRDNPTLQQQMTQLVDSCDIKFKSLLDRYKYFDRYPEYTQIEYRQQAEFFLQILEEKLSQNIFLMYDNISFADIAIFPFIRQFAGVDAGWLAQSPYRKLQTWLDTCVNTDLFKAVMQPR